MAAMMLEPRDPEMSHFIDQYKFERQMAERRDKFGGGTVRNVLIKEFFKHPLLFPGTK